MSPTSIPTELLQHLTLDPQMSPTSAVVQSRAAELRDVLSSFDREILPAEYRLDIFTRLDRPMVSRPQMQSEWTVQQDLVATILQWGSYDEEAFLFLQRIQSPQTRTRLFHEKLNRRFQDVFHHYDVLHGTVATSREAHHHVGALADKFLTVIHAVHEDRQYRELGQPRTAGLVLDALMGVCSRHEDIMLSDAVSPGTEQSSKTPPAVSRTDTSLFQALVRDSHTSSRNGLLILELLESYPPAILRQQKSGYEELMRLLSSNGAPKAYIDRVSQLMTVALGDALQASEEELADEDENAAKDEEQEQEEVSEPPESSTVPQRTRAGVRAAAKRRGSTRPAGGREGGLAEAATTARTGSKRAATPDRATRRGRKKQSRT